jgi:beta-phosphoglucomutase-like phosphatase (HAD superfamily)
VATQACRKDTNVDLVCDELGLRPFLSAIVTGADVQRGKPDPQVFETAAARMGVSPSSCVVVEDAPVGLEAARRAGMRCIGLLGTHPAAALSAADRVIRRLGELRPETVREILRTGTSGA